MICFKAAALLAVLTFIRNSSGFVDIELIHGKPIFWGNNETINFDYLRVRRVNRSDHLVTGRFETFVDLGEDFEIENWVYKKSGNTYKKLPYHTGPDSFCKDLEDLETTNNFFVVHCDVPQNATCPWPKESFVGDYMVEQRFLRNGKLANGYQFYFTLMRFDDSQ